MNSRAYFLLRVKPRKNGISFDTYEKPSVLYNVQRVEWIKKPHFLMKEKSLASKVPVIGLDVIKRTF